MTHQDIKAIAALISTRLQPEELTALKEQVGHARRGMDEVTNILNRYYREPDQRPLYDFALDVWGNLFNLDKYLNK